MADLVAAPTAEQIAMVRHRLGERVRRTPVWEWMGESVREACAAARVFLKLELLQFAGSFKPRGALNVMIGLDEAELARGVTAVSAGNHAMAVAYAARAVGTSAKVVMPQNADRFRVESCRSLGAEVELVADVHAAFDRAKEIEADERRKFVHPFDGPEIAAGTATLGLEIHEQIEGVDVVVVPIGGGGLCAGVAAAIKQLRPASRVIGVEPAGADSMHRSFAAGEPQSIEAVRTIADSLGAPYALPYSFGLCQRFVDELVVVDDGEIRRAMRTLFAEAKLAVEPAGAATTAALLGPLAGRLNGRVAAIVCGANIDLESFARICAG